MTNPKPVDGEPYVPVPPSEARLLKEMQDAAMDFARAEARLFVANEELAAAQLNFDRQKERLTCNSTAWGKVALAKNVS